MPSILIGATDITPEFMRTTISEAFVSARSAKGVCMFKQGACFLAALVAMTSTAHARSAMAGEAYNQGVQQLNAGHYDEAAADFDKALDRDSEFTEAYYARA